MCDSDCSKCCTELAETLGLKFGSVYPSHSTACDCDVCKAKLSMQEANLGGSIGDTSDANPEYVEMLKQKSELPLKWGRIVRKGIEREPLYLSDLQVRL